MSQQTAPRIDPLLPPDWCHATMEAASAFPASRDYVLNNWESGEARGMNGLGAILKHPALAKAFLTFNNHIAMNNTLSKRICELLILRTSWLRKSEYEFQQHVILGMRAGLSEEEIEWIQQGPNASGWNQIDAWVLQAADDLVADASIHPDTWQQLCTHFTTEQMMDMVFTVGCYEVLAMAFKSFAVPFESSLPPMSSTVKARMYGSAEPAFTCAPN